MYFLAFEGIDGCGKSTLIKALKNELVQRGLDVEVSREPGGSPLIEELRQILIEEREEIIHPRCELLLYEAFRAQNVEKNIRPWLQEKKWVLCDRFTSSSLAFQTGGRGIPEQEVKQLNDYAVKGCEPHLFVLIDLSVKESQKRRQSRKASFSDRFEKEEEPFHERVRQSYLKQVKDNPEKWFVLEGSHSPDELLQKLTQDLEERKWL